MSCAHFLAWLTVGYYLPAAVDILGFRAETPQLHKEEKEGARVRYD